MIFDNEINAKSRLYDKEDNVGPETTTLEDCC